MHHAQPAATTLGIGIVLLGLLMSTAGCRLLSSQGGSAGADVQPRIRAGLRTVQVTRGEITSLLVYPGELRPKAGAIVASRVAGRIDRLAAEPGAMVHQGDTLVELDRSALEMQAVQAQATLAAAEARLAGLKAGGDLDSQAEADASLRAARARLASLEAAPSRDAIPVLAQAARDARTRLAELEGGRTAAIASAEDRLFAARQQLEAALLARPADAALTASSMATEVGTPTASPVAVADAPASAEVEQARSAVLEAQQEVARARQPISPEELGAARQQLADAEDALLMARWPVGPSDLDEARANVEAAEARMRRAGQPASDAAIKAGESAVQYAGAAVELARLQLQESTVVAPINGIVVETHQQQGATIGVGVPLVTIQPPDYEMAVAVEERQLGQVSPGQSVSVLVDVYAGESFTGTIRSISPSVDPRTRTVAARVDVQDPRAKLKSGLLAQVAVAGARRSGALIVPREAIVGAGDVSVMTVVEGRARKQPVQIGVQDGRNVEITQGLAEGTEVILAPVGIVDGDSIGQPAQ